MGDMDLARMELNRILKDIEGIDMEKDPGYPSMLLQMKLILDIEDLNQKVNGLARAMSIIFENGDGLEYN